MEGRMGLPTLTKAELTEKINRDLNQMAQHQGKQLEVFVTRSAGRKWSVGLHGDETLVCGQALYDAQTISSRLTAQYDLID
jgi:hypothetical protein